MQTRVSHSFDFCVGGNAVPIQISGWSVTETHHTWAVGKRSVLAIDNVVAPHGFFLEVDWHPFLAHPYRPDQVVLITAHGHHLRPYRLTQRETAAFYCPPPLSTDKKVLVTFEHPDTARIAEYVETDDPREVSVAFRRLRILPLTAPPPTRLMNSSTLKAKATGEKVTIQTAQGPADMGLGQLLTQFEMLAGNCDLGLAMRALGFEQLSLL